jgi:hypothetical protein
MVTIVNYDAHGNFWRETLCINDALLTLLRFARQNPESACLMKLRSCAAVSHDALPRLEIVVQDIQMSVSRNATNSQGEREKPKANSE